MTTASRTDFLPLSRGEWVAVALAVIVAHLFYWREVLYSSAFDAQNYLDIATDLARNGFFGKFKHSEIRTYGYPLFLQTLDPLARLLRLPWSFVIVEVQLGLYLGAAWWLRAAIARSAVDLARVVFVAVLVNPFALLYVAETLTEGLSLVLLVFAAACWAHLFASGAHTWRLVIAGSLALGFAVMVRPANLFALPAWGFALVLVPAFRHAAWGKVAALLGAALVAMAIPMLPQLANNVRHHDAWTPLVAAKLARNQQVWGIANLKYATALPPVPVPSIYYVNPFAQGRKVDEARPLAWYAEHPGAGAATIALHTFGMLDPDLFFTYARTLDPWYRKPVGVLTHAVLALAILGAIGLALRASRDVRHRAVFAALAAFVVCHVAIHAPAAVEMRFGLPLLVLAGPLALWFLREARPSRVLPSATAAVFVVSWTLASLALSDWMRAQSPQIREWQELSGDR